MTRDMVDHPILVLTCCVVAAVGLFTSEAPYLGVLPLIPLTVYLVARARSPKR